MRRLLALCLTLSAATQMARAREVDVDGRVSLRGYYSADSAGYTPVGITFLETDAKVTGLTELELGLLLDATFILDATEANERRFGETEGIGQVRQLHVEQPRLLGRFDLSFGRKLLFEAGNAWVDGLDAEVWFDRRRASLGVYGGLSPDRFDRSLTPDYQAAGVYGTFHRDGLDLSAAYNALLFEGELDRHWAFNRAHWKAGDGLFLSSYLVVDFAERAAVTTWLGTVDYTPIPAVNLALNLSRYSIEQFRNQAVYRNVVEPNQALILGDEIIDLVYNRARLSASLRVWRTVYHYQSLELKQRSQDGRDSFLYTVGIRDDDLAGTGLRVDLSGQLVNNFLSDSYLVSLDLARDLAGQLGLGARLTWFDGRTVGRATERGRTFDEAQQVVLMGVGVNWRLSQSHHLDAWYDGIYEAELQDARNAENLFIHTGMLRYSWLY
ncbi:MAG: hypothetical protein KC613_12770 [Myxococcales bacterium]|nr:hypothetical protein [Myxococcales bacterium]MCB9525036.1 hypothetical protein [Myxococcales bacterium]